MVVEEGRLYVGWDLDCEVVACLDGFVPWTGLRWQSGAMLRCTVCAARWNARSGLLLE